MLSTLGEIIPFIIMVTLYALQRILDIILLGINLSLIKDLVSLTMYITIHMTDFTQFYYKYLYLLITGKYSPAF